MSDAAQPAKHLFSAEHQPAKKKPKARKWSIGKPRAKRTDTDHAARMYGTKPKEKANG